MGAGGGCLSPGDGKLNQRGEQQDLSSPAHPQEEGAGLQADPRRAALGRVSARIWGTGCSVIRKETPPATYREDSSCKVAVTDT